MEFNIIFLEMEKRDHEGISAKHQEKHTANTFFFFSPEQGGKWLTLWQVSLATALDLCIALVQVAHV